MPVFTPVVKFHTAAPQKHHLRAARSSIQGKYTYNSTFMGAWVAVGTSVRSILLPTSRAIPIGLAPGASLAGGAHLRQGQEGLRLGTGHAILVAPTTRKPAKRKNAQQYQSAFMALARMYPPARPALGARPIGIALLGLFPHERPRTRPCTSSTTCPARCTSTCSSSSP